MSENILDKHGTEEEISSSEILTELEAVSLEENDGSENVRYNRLSTCADEGDGLMKIVRTLTCGVNKNKLLYEDTEPYSQVREPTNKHNTRNRQTDADEQREGKTGVSVANVRNRDSYDFTHRYRGYIVLVVNYSFISQSPRDGASFDLHKMKEVAQKFRFRSLNIGHENNMSKSEIMQVLRKAQNADHSHCDCFMFMISTHGLEQRNPAKSGKVDHALDCADDQQIFTSTIMDMFNDTNCPTLKGKPKIFFIQACRGTEVDHGSDVSVVNSGNKVEPDKLTQQRRDERDTNAGSDSWIKTPAGETFSVKCHGDMLVMFAIPPGMLAWRSICDGSWMIHYLHEVLMAYDTNKPKHLLNLLTNVVARMSRRMTVTPMMPELHEKMAVPVIEHRLIKDIIF